jgi:hypothetical protein
MFPAEVINHKHNFISITFQNNPPTHINIHSIKHNSNITHNNVL